MNEDWRLCAKAFDKKILILLIIIDDLYMSFLAYDIFKIKTKALMKIFLLSKYSVANVRKLLIAAENSAVC